MCLDRDITISEKVFDSIVRMYGVNSTKINNTLHKSLSYVENASDEELLYDQLLHYFSTYGREALGLEARVVIPNEVLKLPEGEDSIVVNIIHVLDHDEIVAKMYELIYSNMAMKKNTLESIVAVIEGYDIKFDINEVKNKELFVRLCAKFNVVPRNPSAFLRYIVYKVTGNSLLINRSREMQRTLRMAIRYSSYLGNDIQSMLENYVRLYGSTLLEETFFRYKYIWVALKDTHTANFINRLRKKANKAKRRNNGLKVLDRLTTDNNIAIKDIKEELKKVSIYKKIALINMINYHNANPSSYVYRIRNGKSYIKEASSTPSRINPAYYNVILCDIIESLKDKFANKKFYIPSNVNYALPTSEKKFVGFIPYGSYIDVGETAIVGCYWENKDGHRIDLDLHANMSSGRCVGWDSSYRSENRDILFTGDMTDGCNGATEAIYTFKEWDDFCSLDVCFFNHISDLMPFEYKLIVDGGEHNNVNRNYILSKKSMLTMINLEMETSTQTIGFLSNVEGIKRLHFFNLGTKGITTSNNSYKEMQLAYAQTTIQSQFMLRDLIEMCNGELVEEMEEDVIDLSVNSLTKETFVEMFNV